MGCACGKEVSGADNANGGFLVTQDKEEFLATITPEEKKYKKVLVWFWHLLEEGSFDNEFVNHRNRIVSRAIKDGVPPRFRWQFFRSATDYKNGYRSGEFQKLVEVGDMVVARFQSGHPAPPIRLVSADTGSLSPAPRKLTGSLSEGGIPPNQASQSTPRATGSSVPVTPIRGPYPEQSYVRDVIKKDLRRTFPDMPFFNAEGQKKLNRILLGYAGLNKSVGYCQGMNFIAGFLLAISADANSDDDHTEEEAFWVFVQIMNSFGAATLYADSTPLLHLLMYQYTKFFERQLPDVYRHMSNLSFMTEMYLPQWILTLFCKEFPFATVQRIWEFMLCRGLRSLIEISLGIMHLVKDDIMRIDSMENMKSFLRKAPGELDPNKIVKSADSISNKYKQDREWRDKANPYDMLEREWSEENPQISKMLALAVGNTFKISNKKQFVGGLCDTIEPLEAVAQEPETNALIVAPALPLNKSVDDMGNIVDEENDENEQTSPLTEKALAALDNKSQSLLEIPIPKRQRSHSLDPPKRVGPGSSNNSATAPIHNNGDTTPRSNQVATSARDNLSESAGYGSLAEVIPARMSKESTSAEGMAEDRDVDVNDDALRLPPPPSKGDTITDKEQTVEDVAPMPF